MDNNLEKIVTLQNQKKYYIAAETIQSDKKYYLANLLDENEELTPESFILEETIDGEKVYLDIVTDDQTIKYLAAVFTTNIISDIDEGIEE